MKTRKTLSLLLALALCAGLLAVPAAAATAPFQITWLPVSGWPRYYNRDLNWVAVWNSDTETYHVIDLTTNTKVEEYSTVQSFSEGLAAVGKKDADGNEKCGYIDRTGTVVIPLEYDVARSFSDGLAAVCIGEYPNIKCGFIDKTGAVVVPPKYDGVWNFSEGLAAVWTGEVPDAKYGFIDRTGAVVIPLEYNSARSFSEGLAAVGKGDANGDWKYGFIDKTGAVVIPLEYDEVWDFSEGLAAVRIGDPITGKWGFIDKTGRVAVPVEYDSVQSFSEGLALVGDQYYPDKGSLIPDWRYGYVDQTGTEVIPPKYDFAGSFSEGLALVSPGGYIDKTGATKLISKEYDGASSFSNGLAAIRRLGSHEYGCIDKTGAVVVPAEYDYCGGVENGLCYVKKGDSYGVFFNPYWTPENGGATAYQSTQAVQVDGKSVTFACYALKDANGNLTNYIKLRDLADILNGSAAQFQVGWDGAVTITTKTAYTPNGSEGNTPFSGDRAYQEAANPTKVNGQSKSLAAFVLNDDAGGGYTYYQLRDLGKNLGFNVGWSADKGMFIETDKPYDPAN